MLYTEFFSKACDICIGQADNGLFYLEPLWKNYLIDNELNISDISDIETSWDEAQDVFKLEVEKRNTINTLKPYVLNWVYDVITASVEPAILQEENDYMKNIIEYMKAKQTQDK